MIYAKYVEKENARTGIQLLRWSYPIYGRFLKTRIENLEKSISLSIPARNNKKNKNDSKKRKLATFANSDIEGLDKRQKGKKFRQYHGTCGHTTDQCSTLMALVKQAKQKRSKYFDKFTKHEVNFMVQKQVKKALK